MKELHNWAGSRTSSWNMHSKSFAGNRVPETKSACISTTLTAAHCHLQVSESVSSEDVAGRGRSRFEREAALFGAFRREWSLKLAKAVAAAFDKASKQYRLNLDAFSGSEEGCGMAGLVCARSYMTGPL